MRESVYKFFLPLALAASALTGILIPLSAEAKAACAPVLPQSERPVLGAYRPISAGALVGLRDIGFSNGVALENPIGVSPDGRRAAFVLSEARPEQNDYCQSLVVVTLSGSPNPKVVDDAGPIILGKQNVRGIEYPVGTPLSVHPVWSPDGRSIAYLKSDGATVQAWAVGLNGGGARQVTHSEIDVESVAWTRDSRSLIYSSRPGLLDAMTAIGQEALGGFHYDDRFGLSATPRPGIPLPIPFAYRVADVAGGQIRNASDAEIALISPPRVAGVTELSSSIGEDGQRAWTAQNDPTRFLSPVELWATKATGNIKCADSACSGDPLRGGIVGPWWVGHDVLFMRREGWGKSETALYRWHPGGRAERLLLTENLLTNCQLAPAGLLCLRESSTEPRRLVLIDVSSGRERVAFDPNPEFRSIQLGTVQRLHWRNSVGFECFGDLVLPTGYRRGQKVPLIVVQYRTRGFLRGGTGDEYPIFLFAQKGFAVLSVEEPPFFYESLPHQEWKTWQEAEREDQKDWRQRKSVLSSLVTGVNLAISLGVADPARIGITGVSEGATGVRYALINTHLFAAAAISTCCFDGRAMMALGGTNVAREYQKMGFPPADDAHISEWKPADLTQSATEISTPLLIQIADNEFVSALEAYSALNQACGNADMFVFPDEFHHKWQPAHRLAIYERSVDWFQCPSSEHLAQMASQISGVRASSVG